MKKPSTTNQEYVIISEWLFSCSVVISRGKKPFLKFQPFPSTVEDVFVANIENDRGTVEQLRIYDTAGLGKSRQSLKK